MRPILGRPGVPDWVVIAYLASVVIGLVLAPAQPGRQDALALAGGALVVYLGFVLAFRARDHRHPLALALGRGAAILVVLLVYLNLRTILPILNPRVLDGALVRLDVAVLGFEPALRMQDLATPRVVEWFAFFYYTHFYLMASYVFCHLLLERDDRRLAVFATGTLLVNCGGQFLYSIVPGVGPYAHLAHEYRHPLVGGPFLYLVHEAVGAGGAHKDIFPSLHTATPWFMALFALRFHRRRLPLTTGLTFFFAANIAVATLLLRWHYLIDVVAGLALAVTAVLASPLLVDRHARWRARHGMAEARVW